MTTNILAAAVALPDGELLARIDALAGKERETSSELVAHLAALELRPSLYAAEGYGSLFDYCTRALRLSEDAAYNRIAAANACRRFPAILDHLASGVMTLTSVRLLRPHLTPENHEAVLARARNKPRGEIEALIAELAPKPDVVAAVRKLPVSRPIVNPPSDLPAAMLFESPQTVAGPTTSLGVGVPPGNPPACPSTGRPIVKPLAPERYRVQFTIGQESRDKLRRVQALLRREVPNGDPGAIFERALDLLLEKVEKPKFGVPAKSPSRRPEARAGGGAYESRIRFETDKGEMRDAGATGDVPYEIKTALVRHERPPSRHIPNQVKRAVWYRDGGQCAFVSATGRRCMERSYLELHHIQPYALDGPATVRNIALRCRRHNHYESELVFGERAANVARPG